MLIHLRFFIASLSFCMLFMTNIFPCTMIVAENDSTVLAGNNEDYSDTDTYMWFVQQNNERPYGCIYFGYSNFVPQGGMNEEGLCFDLFATVPNPVENSLDLPFFEQNLMDFFLCNCSRVSEVIETLLQYNLSFMTKFQILIADRYGDSAIIEGDEIIMRSDYYQICTNFYQSNPSLGGFPCWRYDTAVEMFEEYEDSVSFSFFKNILNATHQEGQYPTLYTNIYDLKNGNVHLFYNHYYNEVIKIDLSKELLKENRNYQIPSLYSNLNIISPANESMNETNTVTFSWEGDGKNYKLYYSTDPEFIHSEVVEIDVSDYASKASSPAGLFLFIILIINLIYKKKKFTVPAIMVIFIFYFSVSCNQHSTSPSVSSNLSTERTLVSITLDSFQSGHTYYWKISAQKDGPFRSEGPVYSFCVNDN